MDDMLEQSEQQFTLTWRRLSVIKEKKNQVKFWRQETEKFTVLNNVSGLASSGNILAIMGPSGAGKTTLLTTISCRNKFSPGGCLLLNGIPVTPSFMAGCSGFAPQKDLIFDRLTVHEHMSFNAALKMSTKIPKEQQEQRIRDLLSQFGITNCSCTQLRAVSGGEMKRVTLCSELLNDPLILFCDEPTTGLDSWASSIVVGMLRKLAESGKIVICSIHQPASDTFEMFHKVLLLSDGRTAFHGSTKEAAQFLKEINWECPENYSLAEYFISKISERSLSICDQYDKSNYALETSNALSSSDIIINSENFKMKFDSEAPLINHRKKYKPGLLMQFRWLIWRLFITQTRSVFLTYEFIPFMVNALLVALPFTNLSTIPNQASIQNVAGLLYTCITECVFLHIYGVTTLFPDERPKVLREIANGVYTPAPYYASKVIALFFTAAINSIFFGNLIYWITGLQNLSIDYFYFILILILTSNIAIAYGLLLSAAFETIDIALLVSVILQLVALLFSGIYMSLRSISPYALWIKYLSIFRYGTENLLILYWGSIDYIECSSVDQSCILNGVQVLDKYGYSIKNFVENFSGLCILYILCHLGGYFFVYARSKKQAIY